LTVGLLEQALALLLEEILAVLLNSEQNEQHFAEESWQSDPFEAGS
jgi:hypothetical protein